MAGIYVHVPFCLQKCLYCDFYSVSKLSLVDTYIKALEIEITQRAYELEDEKIDTIYIGGGTPSLLPVRYLFHILNLLLRHFNIQSSPEVTIECNPGDAGRMEIEDLLSMGINRFSVGVQSFDDEVLSFLGRRHTSFEAERFLSDLRKANVHSLSIDLIYGIPHTDILTLRNDIDTLLLYQPEHISAYHLIIEEGTPFGHRRLRGELKEIDEESSLTMSHYLSDRLSDVGYEHYEISNFALPGHRSRHNTSYWMGIPYIGLGPSAHSFDGKWRSYNPASLQRYTQQLLTSSFLSRMFERQTPKIAYEEYILTRLRTSDGISLEEVNVLFGDEIASTLALRMQPYLKRKYLFLKSNRYVLTRKGIDISDSIMSNLFL